MMVTVLEKEETLSAFSADDEKADAELVAAKINSAGVTVTTRNSVEPASLEAAKDAHIVSLDVRIGRSTFKSIEAAKWLKEENPFRAIFFFTRVPELVNEWPVNFLLVKNTRAAELLNRIPLMILVHDVSLALLREIVVLLRARYYYQASPLSGLLKQLRDFYYLLRPIERSAGRFDQSLALRYQELRASLSPFIENADYLTSQFTGQNLSAVSHLLVDNVSRELGELEKIDGVRVRADLRDEITSLRNAQASLTVVESPLESGQTKAGDPDEEIHGDDDTEASEIYLNVWFPDRPVEKPWLLLGKAARMLVNLGDEQEETSLGTTAPVSEESEARLETVDYVDVLVVCADADVVPLRSRIQVPPRKETTAQFEVTPLRIGEILLTVILLIKNDPIHRTPFYFEARNTEPES